jgi:hypothetical protein
MLLILGFSQWQLQISYTLTFAVGQQRQTIALSHVYFLGFYGKIARAPVG